MMQVNRLDGGLIDRETKLNFSFNGQAMTGYAGDTLASALLANGQTFVARSFKYHRPRGIFSAGSEEPNALMQLGIGNRTEPNTRATVTELYQGLKATSQNHLGSLKHDFMAINDLFSPMLSAGFYYKTFMWPKSFWEKFYEPVIRSSAGLGMLSEQPDPDCYDKGFLHCDILVIGSGPSGLAAALSAGRSGARVILADEDYLSGGRFNAENFEVDGMPGNDWAKNAINELNGMDNVRFMPRTTIFGAFDHGVYGALERIETIPQQESKKPRQILWRIYSKQAILCTGATEQPIAFGNNDRPGIMLAASVRAYLNRWAVKPGSRVAVFTNNDNGWQTAIDLQASDVEVTAVVDTRNKKPVASLPGTAIIMGGSIVDTKGRHGIRSIRLSNGQTIETDCLAVSGGWSPNIHLSCHHRGRPMWRDDIAAFVPGEELPIGMTVAGAANGTFALSKILKEGHSAGIKAAKNTGFSVTDTPPLKVEDESIAVSAFWHVTESRSRAWVDLQNDVTTKDIGLAYREGYRSVEHMKRYTTLGMATDQGKTANLIALSVMAEKAGKSIAETGTTIFRPPFTPVSIGALAGHSRGRDYRPYRHTPSHQWAEEQSAVFVEAGLWLRAQWFPVADETDWRQSVDREVSQTRSSVGVCDVTTLGKIDIQGRDASDFLNRVYCNGFAKLPIGKTRYGLMLREDGLAMDDGTTSRFSDTHFVMTTTTVNAVSVFRHLEFCRQCLWPELDVHLISVTEQWAQYAVAGPNSRKLLEEIIDPEFDISNEAFSFMSCAKITVCGGTPARLFRISFSGELAYEIAVPMRYGDSLIRRLMNAGESFGVVPYGTEALSVMRIEKGHPAGPELNGQTTARNLGMGRMVSKQNDCIGNILSEREELNREDGYSLMGFKPIVEKEKLAAGTHFIGEGRDKNMENDEGWMSSVAFSPSLGYYIGLGFIRSGKDRVGEKVIAVDPLRGTDVMVEIVSPHFIDSYGERLRV